MKNTQNKSGFTLVELIIVITILAVLATIAFLSFQGYAAQSRDAKVSSEIGNIRNSVEVKTTE
jgi:prepilin-type N-terminal cleavage/methylation domain-containing protein